MDGCSFCNDIVALVSVKSKANCTPGENAVEYLDAGPLIGDGSTSMTEMLAIMYKEKKEKLKSLP